MNSRDVCWCGLPVWKHVREAEKLEARAGYVKPKPQRKRYAKLPLLELDYDESESNN